MKKNLSRRHFIQTTAVAGLSLAAINGLFSCTKKPKMTFGLVTYQWGAEWDLPTLIANCQKTGFEAIELRTMHAHGVETSLTKEQRSEVKKRFKDSNLTCVGYGSNYEFHSVDPAAVRQNIEGAKEYVKLCSDIGSTGLKVKPNGLPTEVPKEKTIAQIAASLNEVGKFASDYGQLIRVEAHGRLTQELPNMKAIFDQVTEPNVKICLNSGNTDFELPGGLEGNFNLVKQWVGDTVHVHELNAPEYPYSQLFKLLSGIDFDGYILLEASTKPDDKLAAMKEQVSIFNSLIAGL